MLKLRVSGWAEQDVFRPLVVRKVSTRGLQKQLDLLPFAAHGVRSNNGDRRHVDGRVCCRRPRSCGGADSAAVSVRTGGSVRTYRGGGLSAGADSKGQQECEYSDFLHREFPFNYQEFLICFHSGG